MTKVSDPKAVISHEIQLGQGLNRAISNQARDSFRLFLCSLSSDIEDQSQFHLHEQTSEPSTLSENERLRRQFQLGPAAELYASDSLVSLSIKDARVLNTDGLTQVKLIHALKPRPIVGEASLPLPVSVISQLPHWKRKKLEETSQEPVSYLGKPEILLDVMKKVDTEP